MERIEFRIERIFQYFIINLDEDSKLIINQYGDNSIEIDGCIFKSDFDLFNHAMRYAQNIISGEFELPSDCKSVDIEIKNDVITVNK